jgi:hypothetical protein
VAESAGPAAGDSAGASREDEHEEQRRKMERVLDQMVERFGPTHLDVLAARHRLGSLLASSSSGGDASASAAAALAHFRAAIDGYTAVLGANHEKTLASIRDFQFCLARQSRGTTGTGRVEDCPDDDADEGVEAMPPRRDAAADEGSDTDDQGDPSLPRVQFIIPDNSAQVSRLSCFFLFLMVAPGLVATALMVMESQVGEVLRGVCVGSGLCRSYYDQLVDIYMSTNQQVRMCISYGGARHIGAQCRSLCRVAALVAAVCCVLWCAVLCSAAI